MIKYKDKIFPDYFIDPVTAIITNSKGEIQETKINECGRPCFHYMAIHKIQVHTHLGYKKGFDIHHIDENKMNNSLSNLEYLTKSEHARLHHKGKHNSEETKRMISAGLKGKHRPEETKKKISESLKGQKLSDETKKKISESISGEKHPFYGKHHSEETKQKMSEAMKCSIWINNGIVNKFIKINSEIPAGFIRGRLKK